MGQKQIINCFRRVDKKFITELDCFERDQAVQQFQKIWLNEKPKIAISLHRRHKVMSNIVEKQAQQQSQCHQIAESLKSRMEKHIKKREHLQIEKLQNFKNLDRIWKDKMIQIRIQTKGEQKKKLEKFKQISKQIQQFWRKKQSPQRSRSKSFSPQQQTGKYNYFSKKQEKIVKSNDKPRDFKFVTQLRQSIEKNNNRKKYSPHLNTQFPAIGGTAQKAAQLKQFKSQRKTAENINYQALKSNQHWKVKQSQCFQNAMEKMEKIMKIRLKVRENLKDEAKKAKNSRILKESMIKDKRYFSAGKVQDDSPHQLRHKTVDQKCHSNRMSAVISDRQSKVLLKRQEINSYEFKQRELTFQQEKEKQKRCKFHRMVRDAVNLYRVQALRQKQ